MKFKQKFHENHKYNGHCYCHLPHRAAGHHQGIFYGTIAIMIFMNATNAINAVARPPAKNIWLRERGFASVAEATTMLQTLRNNASRNPIIAQQSSKTSAPQKPTASVSTTFTKPSNSWMSPRRSPTNSTFLTMGMELTTTTRKNSNNPLNSLTMIEGPTNSHSTKTNSMDASANPSSSSSSSTSNCKSSTGTWGDVDPNIYYLCDMQTKQPLALRCPEGRGYFNGLGYSGCIPFEDWPACVAPRPLEQVHICDSEHMQQPWETMNPNKFYICLQETTEPMLLNCGQGKGFLHVHVSGNGPKATGNASTGADGVGDSEIVGCANWEKWRSYMQCTDYY
ncbi:uncharacterized protein LOC142222658 [Haematobia irritans]|uniref:uncharacterized protein LOC142222658 n=1 Tax=Haematobia irritans TaxID=7368 RepID=UPI003F4FE7FD